jgi:EAL domain-containing protein (putative c-di-GMP-specific phosphodiesterase class I)/ActR/RegA family two-component response regulator
MTGDGRPGQARTDSAIHEGARHDVPARVLIVDDDIRTRVTVAALLRGSANEIVFAESGEDALEQARSWRPDLILLDVMMPGIDGFEVCRLLRADPDIAEIRVFFLTALDDSASRLRGFAVGADDFITKPLNRDEALTRIGGIARLNRLRAFRGERRSLGEPPAPVPPPAAPPEAGLAEAIDRALASLRLDLQPIVQPLPDGGRRVLAHEALLRTGEAAFESPLALLDAAARTLRMTEVGRAVRRCAADWLEKEPGLESLFMNIDAADLVDDDLYDAGSRLARHARRVVLELTERERLEGIPDLGGRAQKLRELGFRVALDDLGGGYAGLNSFVLIDPEVVKLDNILVRGIQADPLRQAVISAMARLCADLGIALIGEGVETEAERDTLLKAGCWMQQGYLFGRPGPRPATGAP